MIIQNGYISIKEKPKAEGIDPATGFPIKASIEIYSEPIPCQYIPNKYNHLGVSNGEHFTVAQYTILIEQQPLPFTAEQVRLTDMESNKIGDFSIISADPLDAVSEIKITI